MAAPLKKTVTLFYDVVSPYTWFAFEVLCRYKTRWNIDLKLKPFFLGGIMNAADNKPPAFVPRKAAYMEKELKLLAKYFNVPLNSPANVAEVLFVKGSLNAQRFITAVDMLDNSKTELVSRELWLRIWGKDQDITTTDSFIQAGQNAGLNKALIQKSIERMKEKEVKDQLRQYTDEALSYGAFGSPTIIVHLEKPVMLFGSDRFPILAQLLGEKWSGPMPDKAEDSKL